MEETEYIYMEDLPFGLNDIADWLEKYYFLIDSEYSALYDGVCIMCYRELIKEENNNEERYICPSCNCEFILKTEGQYIGAKFIDRRKKFKRGDTL